MPPRPTPAQLSLPMLGELTPRGDGSYVLRPRIPDGAGETWLSPKDAARLLGFTGSDPRSSVYRLCNEGRLRHRRPSRGKIQVSLTSIKEHLEACEEPDFWPAR